MKYALAIALVLILVIAGCDESTSPHPPRQILDSLSLMLGTDTLWFTPGDSASTTITILVLDTEGSPMEGLPVGITLDNPQLGYIEFLDTEIRDTTNAQGRVYLLYTAIGTPGDVVFYAETNRYPHYLHASGALAIRSEFLLIGSTEVTIIPDSVSAITGDTIEVEVCFQLFDTNGHGIEGLSIPYSIYVGRLHTFPVTDSLGQACTNWSLAAQQGDHCLFFNFGQDTDSACVHIDIVDSTLSE